MISEKEFYDKIGGDYSDAQSRLMRDSLIRKFVLKFPDDKNFAALKEAIGDERWDDAFSYAHTLKGVSLNLAFARLSAELVTLNDLLRPQNREALTAQAVRESLRVVEKEYAAVLEAAALLN